jgi:serine/threonine protein kinase
MDTVQRFEDRPTLPLVAAGARGVEGLLRQIESAPAMLGRYELRRVIGAGATAVVFEGRDLRLRRRVAVKVAISDGDLDDEYRALCLREEGRILARVDHPYVVRALEWGESGGLPFLAMTHVNGLDMGRYQAICAPCLPVLVSRFADVAEGLAAVHERGFIHRDIKPSNLLVDLDRDCAVICDFGLAAPTPSRARRLAAWETGSHTRVPLGTFGYRAPELDEGALASEASDQYAFCVTLAQHLVGSRCAKEIMDLQNEGRERATLRLLGALPETLRRLLAKGLRRIPEGRHDSMGALGAQLRRVSQLHPPAGAPLAA